MNILSPSNSSFYTDEKTTISCNGLIKTVKQIKSAIDFFTTVIVKNKIELINENIFILIDLIIELDKKVLALVPDLLSNQDEYSEQKLIRTEIYIRLGSLIKFGDRLLIQCTECERQNAITEHLIYDSLKAAIEDYVDEVKKIVNISWEFQVDSAVGSSSPEPERHYNTVTLNQTVIERSSNKSLFSTTSSYLSWCDDEHDINLLKRRGFIRESNISQESGFLSEGSYDLDPGPPTSPVESTDTFKIDLDLDVTLLHEWNKLVSSRYPEKSRITLRPRNSLPSKGKEILFGSKYPVEMTSTRMSIKIDEIQVLLRRPNSRENLLDDTNKLVPNGCKTIPIQPSNAKLIEYENVEHYLWMKHNEDGSSVQGGTVDALIVYACNNQQKDYTDAFITTYKSFIGSRELIDKLTYRFEYFMKKEPTNAEYYRIAKKTFALLLIIVSELINLDLSIPFLEFLIDCTCRIIVVAEIKLGRILREFVIEQIFKFTKRKKIEKKISVLDSGPAIMINYTNLLDISHEILAQQICLLTHGIINNIRSSELLLYIDKQDIDIAPNFSALANHFNSISFWAATTILKENDSKARLKLILYIIRVMRKLLDYGNFESCAALNSAFCNVSVYRILPDLKQLDEFIELFDPAKNFREYRERLSKTKGTCIPILFLLLRDLIHIETGNPNEIHNLINFGKRVQIYNALAVFRKATINPYKFKKNIPVLNFVNGFREFWDEEKLIERSYKIKPRGKVV